MRDITVFGAGLGVSANLPDLWGDKTGPEESSSIGTSISEVVRLMSLKTTYHR